MRLRSMILAIALSLAAFTAHACEDGVWNRLKAEDIQARGLSDRVDLYNTTLRQAMHDTRLGYGVMLFVIDCPLNGHAIRAIKLPTFMAEPFYGLYITVAAIRNPSDEDAVREARRQVCLIATGIADDDQREKDVDDERSARCMLSLANVSKDDEYARWLTRRFDLNRRAAVGTGQRIDLDAMIRSIERMQLSLPDK